MPQKPPVRIIWGFYIKRQLTRDSFSKEEDEQQFEASTWGFLKFWNLSWVDPDTCNFFDTRQKIDGKIPPLEHIEQSCPTCGFRKVHGKIVDYGNPNCQHDRPEVLDNLPKGRPAGTYKPIIKFL